MIRYMFYLATIVIFGCTNNNNLKKTEKEEIEVFFESFIKIKKKDYYLKKVKYIIYGDSLEFKYWIKESSVDTIYLGKIFDSKRSLICERPVVFNNYEAFDFEDLYKYKRKRKNDYFKSYFRSDVKNCELMSINFLVFNKEKNRALIYYSLDCNSGDVEVYSKSNSEWLLLKQISHITP